MKKLVKSLIATSCAALIGATSLFAAFAVDDQELENVPAGGIATPDEAGTTEGLHFKALPDKLQYILGEEAYFKYPDGMISDDTDPREFIQNITVDDMFNVVSGMKFVVDFDLTGAEIELTKDGKTKSVPIEDVTVSLKDAPTPDTLAQARGFESVDDMKEKTKTEMEMILGVIQGLAADPDSGFTSSDATGMAKVEDEEYESLAGEYTAVVTYGDETAEYQIELVPKAWETDDPIEIEDGEDTDITSETGKTTNDQTGKATDDEANSNIANKVMPTTGSKSIGGSGSIPTGQSIMMVLIAVGVAAAAGAAIFFVKFSKKK